MHFLELLWGLLNALYIFEPICNVIRWIRSGCPLSSKLHPWAIGLLLLGCMCYGIMVLRDVEFTVKRLLVCALVPPALLYAFYAMTYDPDDVGKKSRKARKRLDNR